MIARIIALNPAPKTRERVEIAVILDDLLYPGAVKPNPYATSELAVTAVLRAPNGRETAHSAFFTMAPLSDGSAEPISAPLTLANPENGFDRGRRLVTKKKR